MKKLLTLLLLIFISNSAIAATRIVIQGGNRQAIPLAIHDFSVDSQENMKLAQEIQALLKKQLNESALFNVVKTEDQYNVAESLFSSFLKQEEPSAMIAASIKNLGEGKIWVDFSLNDLLLNEIKIRESFVVEKANWFRAAARIADGIYREFTGVKGYFNSQLVFVSEKGLATNRQKRIAIMDLYGDNFKYLTDGKNLVLTPRLSPKGDKVVYVSYKKNQPAVYMRNLISGETEKLVEFNGMTFAPRFSNSGDAIVLSASYDGNSEILLYDVLKGKATRLTKHVAIDTSPSFSPDDKYIVFNSDRQGTQQLYIMHNDGQGVKKIELGKGRYATPVWSPDGRYIAFTKIYKGKFHIGIVNTQNMEQKILTESFKDEAPSWAPNSKNIIFTRKAETKREGKKYGIYSLLMVDLNGNILKRIESPVDASDADWAIAPIDIRFIAEN